MNISHLAVVGVVGIYGVLSKILFDEVYHTSHLIIDEEFHLPLGQQYCRFKFNEWDPKVTTLPGLYLTSSFFLGPFGLCSIYWLRFISLLFSCINLILFYFIFSIYLKKEWQKILSAITVVLLPPLYFFSHVYYTDVVSLTSCLLLIVLSERGFHYFAALAGFFSIIYRQTNVIFLGIYAGKYILHELYAGWVRKRNQAKRDGKLPTKHFQIFIIDIIQNPGKLLRSMSLQFWLNSLSYTAVLIFFLCFLWFNGSIVVGDKSAHQISFNIPQLFYFSLFSLIFGWPYFMGEIFNFLQFAKRHKAFLALAALVALLISHFNTVVHPYLLADNRHLLFYIWNRFYGRYWWFKYSMVPIYVFSLYVILKAAWDKSDISFFLMYVPAVLLLLISQSLLELRYFLVPYLIIRLRLPNKDLSILPIILELVTYLVINILQFNIFFSKVLHWPDMLYPQRIIW